MRRKPAAYAAPLPVHCSIKVAGNRAFIEGEYPLDVVREVTSYFVEGYRFAPAYRRMIWDPLLGRKRRAWDGRCHLFDLRTRSMPAGLTKLVVRTLKEVNAAARISCTDEREDTRVPSANDPAGFTLQGIAFGEGKFDYQLECAKAALGAKRCIIKAATNSGKTEVACAITNYLKVPTLFIVPGVDLLHQTRDRFALRLKLPVEDIGIIGDGHLQIGPWITIATVDSLYTKREEVEALAEAMRAKWQLLFVDECHTAGSDTFYDVLDCINAYYRIGLSGTPLDRTDGADLRLIAQTGDIAYEISNKLLIERGVSVPVEVEFKRIDNKKVVGGNWKSVQKQAIIENSAINDDIRDWVPMQLQTGYQVVILVKEIAHGKKLEQLLREVTTGVQFLHGEDDSAVRKEALRRFTAGELRCLIGTSILYQGIDTPAIDIMVFADLGKSRIAVLQALGRGLRVRPGKLKLRVRDYANFCHKWLSEHSLARLKTYKREDCFTLSVIGA